MQVMQASMHGAAVKASWFWGSLCQMGDCGAMSTSYVRQSQDRCSLLQCSNSFIGWEETLLRTASSSWMVPQHTQPMPHKQRCQGSWVRSGECCLASRTSLHTPPTSTPLTLQHGTPSAVPCVGPRGHPIFMFWKRGSRSSGVTCSLPRMCTTTAPFCGAPSWGAWRGRSPSENFRLFHFHLVVKNIKIRLHLAQGS